MTNKEKIAQLWSESKHKTTEMDYQLNKQIVSMLDDKDKVIETLTRIHNERNNILELSKDKVFETESQARKEGYRPLTTPCSKSEFWIINKVIADMKRGRMEYAIVVYKDYENAYAAAIWKKGWIEESKSATRKTPFVRGFKPMQLANQ